MTSHDIGACSCLFWCACRLNLGHPVVQIRLVTLKEETKMFLSLPRTKQVTFAPMKVFSFIDDYQAERSEIKLF